MVQLLFIKRIPILLEVVATPTAPKVADYVEANLEEQKWRNPS